VSNTSPILGAIVVISFIVITVKLLIQARSQIEAEVPNTSRGSRQFVLIEAGSRI